MALALVNGRILADGRFVEGLAVLIEGERIAAVVEAGDARMNGARRHDLAGATLLPGFIDAQVNGGGGILFNDAPTLESIRAIGAAHRRYGNTGFLPTLISDDLSVIAEAIWQGAPRPPRCRQTRTPAAAHVAARVVGPAPRAESPRRA